MSETLPRSAIEPKNPLLNASRSSNLPHVPGIRVGDYIFLSGMAPIDPRTGERNHGPIAEQVRTTLSNMQHMLESAGSSLERVVRVHVVLADISQNGGHGPGLRGIFPGGPAGAHGLVDAASVRQRLRDRMRCAGGLSGIAAVLVPATSTESKAHSLGRSRVCSAPRRALRCARDTHPLAATG